MARQGRSLQELAVEIERQAQNKRDFVAPVELLGMQDNAHLKVGGNDFALKPLAHSQLAEFTSIPKPYYDRMLCGDPALLAKNVNRWLPEVRDNGKAPTPRLIRVLDGEVRAVLSNGYRRIENYDLAGAILPVLSNLGLTIVSCELTERKLYIKAFDGGIEREIQRAGTDPAHTFLKDVCFPAIVISNSEVGAGSYSVSTSIYTGGCTNFSIFNDRSARHYHSGARLESGDSVYELLTDKTKELTDAAILAQSRDIVKAAFDVVKFEALIKPLQEATQEKISGDVPEVIEVVGEQFGFSKSERSSVLRHLIEGGDLSRYGVFNAVTRAAQDLPDYERATEFERAGGKVIELPRNQWEKLAKAA